MQAVSYRYAQAFFELAEQESTLPEYGAELARAAALWQAEKAFAEFLVSPQYGMEAKKSVVMNAFYGRVHGHTLNLILLLLDKGRIQNLPEIAEEFGRLADRKNNIVRLTVKATAPLRQGELEKICEKFKTLLGAAGAKATVEIDPALIGGLVVLAGDKQYDGSIKGMLSGLKSVLDP